MLFRVIRRAPWIALGAAGAYYFDGTHGAARRADAADRTRALMERGREQWRLALRAASAEDGAVRIDRDAAAAGSLDPSIFPAQVRTDSRGAQAGESRAGVPVPLPDSMAQAVREGV